MSVEPGQAVRFYRRPNAHKLPLLAARDSELMLAEGRWETGAYVGPARTAGLAFVKWKHYTLVIPEEHIYRA